MSYLLLIDVIINRSPGSFGSVILNSLKPTLWDLNDFAKASHNILLRHSKTLQLTNKTAPSSKHVPEVLSATVDGRNPASTNS